MTIDTKKLRTLAETATPGPWEWDDDCVSEVYNENEHAPWLTTKNLETAVIKGTVHIPSKHDAAYIAACSPDVVLELLDALERKDNLLREQLTICKYLSRSICMTDETGADTNPDNIVDSSIEAITKEIGA